MSDSVIEALEIYLAEAAAAGDHGAEGKVLAATARRLAAELDRSDLPPYVIGSLSRELRGCLGQLMGAPGAGPGLTDADLAALLGGLR